MIILRYLILISTLCFTACELEVSAQADSQAVDSQIRNEPVEQAARKPDAISLSGKPLFSPVAAEALTKKLKERQRAFETNPNDPDALIWYGRFVAYTGDYDGAIAIFTQGSRQFPDDARMLRHAGH